MINVALMVAFDPGLVSPPAQALRGRVPGKALSHTVVVADTRLEQPLVFNSSTIPPSTSLLDLAQVDDPAIGATAALAQG